MKPRVPPPAIPQSVRGANRDLRVFSSLVPLALRWLDLESSCEFAATQGQVLDKLPGTTRGKEAAACLSRRLETRVPLSHNASSSIHPSLLSISVSALHVLGTPLLFSFSRLRKKTFHIV